MVALSARQLCLGKVGNPLNFGADRCCHGNEIWARRGDPVTYWLVIITISNSGIICAGCTIHRLTVTRPIMTVIEVRLDLVSVASVTSVTRAS